MYDRDIGERMREAMKAKGLRAVDVAKALQVDRGTVYKWFAGKGTPRIDLLNDFCDLTGCTADYIISGQLNTLEDIDIMRLASAIDFILGRGLIGRVSADNGRYVLSMDTDGIISGSMYTTRPRGFNEFDREAMRKGWLKVHGRHCKITKKDDFGYIFVEVNGQIVKGAE